MEVEIEKVVKAQKEAQSANEVVDREEQTAHNKESKAQVIAEEDAEGLQEPKAISKGRSRDHPVWASRSWTGRREATNSIASQDRRESCEAERFVQEHTAQREVVAVKINRNFWRSPWRTKPEIQVEEKQVAEIKNKVQMVKFSLEVTNSSIKLTPRWSRTSVAEKPLSEKSKDMIRSMGNTEYFEMCEITSKVQCHNCLTYWTTCIVTVLAEHACDFQTKITN